MVITEIVSIVGVSLGILLAINTILVKVWRLLKKVDQAIGVGVDGKTLAQSHIEQGKQLTDQGSMLQRMDTRLTLVESVLAPPGQETLSSRVRAVEEEVDEVRGEVKAVGAQIGTLTAIVKKDINDR